MQKERRGARAVPIRRDRRMAEALMVGSMVGPRIAGWGVYGSRP